MAQDPAFLFYDGDAAKDVSHMNRLERGCYFDLMQAQRKFGRLKIEVIKKVLGKDFDACWESLHICLTYVDHMYFIEWLENSTKKRQEYSESRKRNKNSKKDEKSAHMLDICSTYVQHMENEIENVNEDVIEDKGGMGEKQIAPEMIKSFKSVYPQYPVDKINDATACLQIAYKIAEMKGWPKQSVLTSKKDEALSEWQKIISKSSTDKWYSTRSIRDLNNEWQRLIQFINNTNGQHKKAAGTTAESGYTGL